MVRFFFLFLIVSSTNSCSSKITNSNERINRILISTRIPVKAFNNEGFVDIIDFYLNYYKDYIVYELPYHKTFEIDGRPIYDSVKYDFFVYKINDRFGYLLKNFDEPFTNRISSDSILKARAYGGGVYENPDSFLEFKYEGKSVLKNANDEMIIKYTLNNDIADSIYFYFNSNLRKITFSLSRSMDSVYNSKLVKFEAFLKHDSNIIVSDRKNFFVSSIEMRKDVRTDSAEIKALILRYVNYLKPSRQ